MTNSVKPVPDGASVIIPRLICQNPADAIEFCMGTFGTVERVRRPGPDGAVAHALLTVGPSMVMIEAESPALPSRAPRPGDRIAWIMDPSGHVWTVATRVEETTAQERDSRWASIRESAGDA